MRPTPASVDEYMAGIESAEARATLERLRDFIKSELPEAQETISYGIPAYKWRKSMVCFAAFRNHCSFFPGAVVEEFSDRLTGYRTSKGTIQFPVDHDLPRDLVRAILHRRFGIER